MGYKKNLDGDNLLGRSREAVKRLFHKHGLKCTPQRLAVLSVLDESPRHFSITDIWEKVKLILPETGLATVYRTLETLVDLNLVKRVHLEDGCHSYVAASRGHQHQVVCVDCSRVTELEECPLEDVCGALSRETGFAIENHFLQFFGKCSECQTHAPAD